MNHAYPSFRPLALIAAATLLLSACTSNIQPPNTSVAPPARWQSLSPADGAQTLPTDWWRDAGNPELSTLIEQALIANRDLHIAAARVAQARAQAGAADAELRPRLDASAAANRGRQTVLDPKTTVRRAGLEASWELDVFGARRLDARAATLDAAATARLEAAARTVIAAEVAAAYLDAGTLQQRVRLGQQRLADLDQAVISTRHLFAAGRASRVDIERREGARDVYRGELASIEGAMRERLIGLDILTGATPGSTHPSFANFEQIQFAQAAPWQPGELLERRPDVQRQALAVEAAATRLGMARRDLYPKFIFTWARANEHARAYGDEQTTRGIVLGYGISVTLPILDGGRIRARIDISEAALREATATYEKTMLEALADAETALTRQDSSTTALTATQGAEVAASTALADTQRLFDAGRVDQTAVLDARTALAQAQDTRLQARYATLAAGVDVRRAFSGEVVK